MQFAHPGIFWLFLIYVPLIGWYVWKHRSAYASLSISTTIPFAKKRPPFRQLMLHVQFALRLLALGSLIVVLARPQTHGGWTTSKTEGTDMMLALDISSSMLAHDFKPDRMEAAKKIAAKFINGRENDNMGLVVFAGEAYTGMPLTSDRKALVNYVNSLNRNMLEDGTAVGDGLATALNRIKDGKAKSKSIILLTDGSNNTGLVAPLTAAEIAHKMGVKVYTIGVGTNGMAMTPVSVDMFGRYEYAQRPVEIDESTLRKISDMTGGKYFRATDNEVLQAVFNEIDQLEKTELDVRNFSHTEDNYLPWMLLAFGLLAVELLLRQTYLRTIP